MNLFGFEIRTANEKESDRLDVVNRADCHNAMDNLNKRIDDLKDHIDKRFDDVKDLVKQRR